MNRNVQRVIYRTTGVMLFLASVCLGAAGILGGLSFIFAGQWWWTPPLFIAGCFFIAVGMPLGFEAYEKGDGW